MNYDFVVVLHSLREREREMWVDEPKKKKKKSSQRGGLDEKNMIFFFFLVEKGYFN